MAFAEQSCVDGVVMEVEHGELSEVPQMHTAGMVGHLTATAATADPPLGLASHPDIVNRVPDGVVVVW